MLDICTRYYELVDTRYELDFMKYLLLGGIEREIADVQSSGSE